MSEIAEAMADAKRRKNANRAIMSTGPSGAYDHLMGTPMSPQDHPANNVSHPHGNRGRMDATIPPMSTPESLPQSLGIDDF